MADVLHLGDEVEFVTESFEGEGVPRGSKGVIVDDWADGSNDVEVRDSDTGEVIARVRAAEDEIQLSSDPLPKKGPREHGILFGRGDDLGEPPGGAPSPPGTQFSGLNGGSSYVWGDAEPPPEGELTGDVPWELKDEPPSGPIFH